MHVTVANRKDDRRTCEATRAPDGTYKVDITPVPSEPPLPVRAIEALVEARKGSEVLATVHRRLELAGAPPVIAARASVGSNYYIVRTLPRPPMFGGTLPRVPDGAPVGIPSSWSSPAPSS